MRCPRISPMFQKMSQKLKYVIIRGVTLGVIITGHRYYNKIILGNGTITIGFDECGPQSSVTTGEGTLITSHIHHWFIPHGLTFPISSMSKVTFQCNFK